MAHKVIDGDTFLKFFCSLKLLYCYFIGDVIKIESILTYSAEQKLKSLSDSA